MSQKVPSQKFTELVENHEDVVDLLESMRSALSEGHKHFPKPSNEKEADALEKMAWELYRYEEWLKTGELP